MAMIIEDLGDYLVANGIGSLGEAGVTAPNIFMNYTPELPDHVLVLNEYLSIEPLATMNGKNAPLVERPRLQVLVRHSAQEVVSAYNTSRAAYVLICKIVDYALAGRTYTIEPLDTPTMTGRDDQMRVLFTTNFQITVQ